MAEAVSPDILPNRDFEETMTLINNSLNIKTALRLFLPGFSLVLPLLTLLIITACSDDGTLPVGSQFRGNTLFIRIEEMNKVQEIRYQGTDRKHYLVAPSSRDNELLALRLVIQSPEANIIQFTVDADAAVLNGFNPGEEYMVLDVTPSNEVNVREVDASHPSEGRFTPFIRGPYTLEKDHAITGTIVFEIPEGAGVRSMRWEAGDSVNLRPH